MSKHKWGDWRHLVLTGRIRKRGINNPNREHWLLRKALDSLGLRYREYVPIMNPDYHGWKGDAEASIQWLEFAVFSGRRLFIILFKVENKHSWSKPTQAAKIEYLTKHNVPFLILPRTFTSPMYAIEVQRFIRKEKL